MPNYKPTTKFLTRNYDAESRKRRLVTSQRKKQPPPPESDSDEYISSQSDSELENELDMKEKDDSRKKNLRTEKPRKRLTDKDTSQQEAIHSTKETETNEVSLSAAPHMIMASAMYHMRLAPVTFPTASTYVPTFYMFYFALNSAQLIVHENTYLKYIAPNYLTVASSLYYGYLGFIHILRAKTIAGIITKAESQVLRRFEREYPFETLPIMSPLIMFFQNLGAVKLADPMYTWICPTLPTIIGTGPNEKGIFANDNNIVLPNIPALIKFLTEIGEALDVEAVTRDNQLVPHSWKAKNTQFFGIDFADGKQTEIENQRLIYSAGWLEPPEIPDSIDDKVTKRIRRWHLPTINTDTDLSSIIGFLQTERNLEWFKNLINVATEESKFFKGSTNFGAIPATSGLSSLIEIRQVNKRQPAAKDLLYPISSSHFPSELWKIDGLTTRGETSPEEFKIGATTQFLMKGISYYTPQGHARPVFTTDGPYFDTTGNGRQVAQTESDDTRTPRSAFEQIIRSNLYDETGKQIALSKT
jgi:hypothetical protein